MWMNYFWAQNGAFAPNKSFFCKNHTLMYLIAPLIVQNFKKNS